MKKVVGLLFFAVFLFSLPVSSASLIHPEWYIFLGADGSIEIYDDGCNSWIEFYDEISGSGRQIGSGACR